QTDLRYSILVNRGVMRFRRGDASGAIADLTQATVLAPDFYQAYGELATVLARRGQTIQSAERFAQAIARNPDSASLYRARADVVLLERDPAPAQMHAALRDLAEALRLGPRSGALRARDLANQAWLLERLGRLEDALAANEKALELVADYTAALQQ